MSDITPQINHAQPFPGLPGYDEDYPAVVRNHAPRIWPAVVLVALQWAIIKAFTFLMPATFAQFMALFYTPILTLLGLIIWWLFASRLRWSDRLLGLAVLIGTGVGAFYLFHPSMGIFGLFISALPWINTTWVAWMALSGSLSMPVRRVGFVLVALLTWGYFDLLRMDGIDGSMNSEISYRWERNAEDRFLAEMKENKKAAPAAVVKAQPLKMVKGDWTAFRGENRDGRLSGVTINTDWKTNPPKKLWSKLVGPSWSSFAVIGDNVFTQEQRGKEEVVICLDLKTGEEKWIHKDPSRFEEAVAGPGPRSTPTFHDGKVYSLGANGILNCLDAATGSKVWAVNIQEDSQATLPQWGFSSSPLVADGIVTVFAGNPEDKSLLGYEAATGKLAWSSGKGKMSYCSPQLSKVDGIEQILITTDVGLTAFQPKTGEVLWEFSSPSNGIARVVQPAVVNGKDVLVGTGLGFGTSRVVVNHAGKEWSTSEVWKTTKFKPYFNDFVMQDGYMYGFDNNFFCCLNVEDGKETWRARGYGNGQVLLLVDQKLLLILTEKGEIALVEAKPSGHKEIAKIPGIKGKTWNHPVIAQGKLLIRNGEEMACFELQAK